MKLTSMTDKQARKDRRKQSIIKGTNDKEKWSSVERALQRLTRRAGHFIFGLPPYTILTFYCPTPDGDGVLARAMLPRKGRIVEGCFAVDMYANKAPVVFNASLYGLEDVRTGHITTRAAFAQRKMDLEVKAGDRLVIDVKPVTAVMGVWVSLGYQADLSLETKEQFYKEQFLREVEDAEEAAREA